MTDWRERAETPKQRTTGKGVRYYEGEPEVIPPKADPAFEASVRASERFWRSLPLTPLNRLRWVVGRLGRLDNDRDHTAGYEESVAELRIQAGTAIQQADPKEVLAEPRVRELVMTWWGEQGVERLRARAAG
jgi:hypothetical protein